MAHNGHTERDTRRAGLAPVAARTAWLLGALFAAALLVVAMSAPVRAADAVFSGDRQGATELLQRFLAPGADLRALTLLLRPRRDDYLTAYRQPLAGRLAASHEQLWADETTAIGPQAGQSELLLGVTTTDRLIAGKPELEEFPGGYRQVLDFLQPGVPIARFRFVAPGATLGMSFDGLVYVNRRWVFIPKPWRALP